MARPPSLILVLALATVLAGAGCGRSSPDAVRAENELSDRPDLITNVMLPVTKITLLGVKLGDSASSLPAGKDEPWDESISWHTTTDGRAAYGVAGGKVVEMKLTDRAALAKLNLPDEETAASRFGKPAQIDRHGRYNTYSFPLRHFRLVWDAEQNRLAAVSLVQ